MGQLTNQFVSQSYQGLLNLENANTGVTATLQYVTDGVGNRLPMQASTSSIVISGSFYGDGSGLTGLTVDSGSFITTSSFNSYTSSVDIRFDGIEAKTGSYATTGSNQFNGNQSISGSVNISGSLTASGLNYPTVDNGVKSFIQTDGAGNLSLQYVDAMYEDVRNGEATQIAIGTPLFVSGSQGNSSIVYRADASNPSRMPATYVATETINSNNNGKAIILGLITGVDTNLYPAGTEVFVGSGGGWSATRPTGSATVQSLGIITKQGPGGSGRGVVLNPGPANLPNLPTDNVWLGDSNSYPTAVDKDTLGFATTGSLSGYTTITDFNNYTSSNDSKVNSLIANTGSYATTSSLTALSQSIATTDLGQDNRLGSLESKTGSYATTGSNDFVGQQNINGSVNVTGSLNVTGEITALSASITYLETIYQTSSVIYSSGSNILGDEAGDTQTLYGTVRLPNGPLVITGSVTSTGGFNGDLTGTASFATNALSASHAVNSDTTISSSFSQDAISSSFAQNALSSSHSVNSDNSISSSYSDYALTASFALNVPTIDTSSFATTGSNVFIGNQVLTGSFSQTGSMSIRGNTSGDSSTLLRVGDPTYGVVDISGNGQITATNVVKLSSIQNWNTSPTSMTIYNQVGDLYLYGKAATGSIVLGINQSSKIQITGSLLSPSITGSLEGNATTATSASHAVNSDTSISSSFAQNAVSSSHSVNSDSSISSSFAQTSISSSFADNALSASWAPMPDVSYFATTGSNTFLGDQTITGSVILSGSAGVELDVKGNQINTGSLSVRSGSIYSLSNTTTVNVNNFLTNSFVGQANIIKGWGDNPTSAGPQSNINNFTGSLRITGSNNTVSMPQIRATGIGGSADMQGYISGSDNTIAGNSSGIFMNTGSLLFPKTVNNYVGANSNIRMTFTTSSLSGGDPAINNNTLYAGTLVLNSNSGSVQAVVGNLFNGGNITSTQNFVTNTRPTIATNLLNGAAVTLNHISSSINYQNNIHNAPVTVNNHLSSSIALNSLTVSNNTFLGGSSNNFHQIYASGSQSTNVTRTIADNLFGGRSTYVTSSFVGSNNSNLISSLIYGQALFVSGNHPTTAGGSAFLGRYNDTTSGLNSVQDIVFAVGTGTSNTTRRTGLYVTSGSLVGVSGSLDVKGNQTVTGSVNISSVMNMRPLDPLPAGNIGDLAVSSSNQLYFYNGAWTLVV